MKKIIGIRREDKNIWEKRVPLIPEHLKDLRERHDIKTIVQPFPDRAFKDNEFISAGIEINEDLSNCPTIIAVKEIPISLLMPEKTYLFFSHTIKGQPYNMPLLQKLMDLKCNLIDYEVIANDKNQRLVFFGKFAGLAGMIEGLHGLGKRLKYLGFETTLLKVKQAYEYPDLETAKEEIKTIGEEIRLQGLPSTMAPIVVGFSGYGNVSIGAQEIFDLLPFKEITPDELLNLSDKDNKSFFKVVFKEIDMFEPLKDNVDFNLQHYFENPEEYKSKFEQYLDKLTLLVNCIYWHDKCPRLITKDYLKNNSNKVKIQLVSDISIDIDGSIEFSYKATEPDNPAFVYNPRTDEFIDGFEGEGIANITIDNLPTELPRNSSIAFSDSLIDFIPGIVFTDFSKPFDELELSPEIKRALILHRGELTDNFKYLNNHLK